jgi:hypothetical protein
MATILCPNCGKENPDSLNACQFCQTPLSSGSTVRIGDKPTKKNTGELEPVLPDWLRDMRQQARDSAEQDAAEAANMPKIQKEEPPDFLAGLASQSGKGEEDELPGWLAGLAPRKGEKPSPSPAAQPESDFFAQFEKPAPISKSEAKQSQPPAPVNKEPGPSPVLPDRDELSDWFAKASGEPSEPFSLESDSSEPDMNWGFQENVTPKASREPEPPAQEDLSWLRNLEAESKKTGELSQPGQTDQWSSGSDTPAEAGSSNQDDLSWLNSLGSLPASEQPRQAAPGSGEDLSWLNAFSATPEAPKPEAPASQPVSQNDLSWLDHLGSLPAIKQSAENVSRPQEDLGWLSAFKDTPAASPNEPAPPAAKDDLGWLDELGGSSLPAQQPFESEQPAAGDELSWLRNLEATPGTSSEALSDSTIEQAQSSGTDEAENRAHVPPFTPSQTAPLRDTAQPELPDWLKSATEEPSMPLGALALDRMREENQLPPAPDENVSKALFGTIIRSKEDQPVPPAQESAPVEPVTPGSQEAAPLFNEASSLFSDELPDWLSGPGTAASQAEEEIGIHAEGGEALSPADLPAWVQAMRPVEAMVAATAIGMDDQPAEREGPLAGLKGVIPVVAIGSLRRPRPIPLTLQTTEAQQASASILEQILQRETTPRPLASAPVVTSQQTLRWIIAGLILFVLGAVLFSGTQILPISPVLAPEARDMPNIVMGIADNAPVLVIMDYQPGLAGEMEAVSGPLLDQLVRLHNPYLTFIATSPGGNVLVERLLANTNISQSGGIGYVTGQNYTNLGYLPGGEAGVLAFLQSPQAAIPASPVLSFSEYAAILLLTDHADSARTWVEQLSIMKEADPTFAGQPLLAVASAQTGPMLQPYFSSGQISGMISGLPSAASYESLNDNRPGMAHTYWDAFGVGMMMAVFLIVLGSLWSVYSGIRAGRMKAEEE